MQNTNKKRLVSASVAAAIAVSQFSPLTAFAIDVAPETVYVVPENKTDESEVYKEAAVPDTSASTSPEVSTEDITSAIPESVTSEMSEEANISPDTDSTMQSAESQNEGLVTDNAVEAQAFNNNAETVSAATAEKIRVTLTAGAVSNGVATTNATREYGCANPDFTPVIEGLTEEDETALANGSKTIAEILGFTPNLSTNALESSAPGDYAIKITNAPAAYGNYEIVVLPGTLHVTRRKVTITVNENQGKVYGDNSHEAYHYRAVWGDGSYVKNPNIPLSPNGSRLQKIACVITRDPGEDAGTYTMHPAPADEVANRFYDITLVDGTYTISKAPLTIRAEPGSSIYGELPRNINIGSVSGFQRGDNWDSVFGANVKPVFSAQGKNTALDGMTEVCAPVGEYTVTGVMPVEAKNYDVIIQPTTLNITPRPVTISVARGQHKIYGETDPELRVNFGGLGIIAGDFANCKVGRAAGEDVGFYRYTINEFLNSADAQNYTISLDAESLNGTNRFEIVKREVRADIDSVTKVYGEKFDPAKFSVSLTGFANEADEKAFRDSVSFVCAGTDAAANAKDYVIAATYAENPNFNVVLHNGTMTVQKRPISLSFHDSQKAYGQNDPSDMLSYDVCGNITENGVDTLQLETGHLTGATQRNEGEYVGSYDIFTALSNDNYTIVYKNGETVIGVADGTKKNVGRLAINRLPINEDVTVVGSLADENGKPITATPEDQFKDSWSISDVRLVAPRGYKISCSDALDDFNLWSDSLIVETPGKDVQAKYFLRNEENGAITEMGSKTVNIDKKAPELSSVEVEGMEENDIKNVNFREYDREINIKLVGRETDTTQSAAENMIMPLFIDEASNEVAARTTTHNPNSGIAAVEYYTLNKSDAQFDAAGDLIIDNSKFKQIELTYTDPNNAYGSIKVSPDFVGYIVTRTKDISGQYSAAAIATVSVIAPKAAPSAPIRNNSKTGVGPIGIAATAIVLGSAVVTLVIIEKKSKKKKGE